MEGDVSERSIGTCSPAGARPPGPKQRGRGGFPAAAAGGTADGSGPPGPPGLRKGGRPGGPPRRPGGPRSRPRAGYPTPPSPPPQPPRPPAVGPT